MMCDVHGLFCSAVISRDQLGECMIGPLKTEGCAQ